MSNSDWQLDSIGAALPQILDFYILWFRNSTTDAYTFPRCEHCLTKSNETSRPFLHGLRGSRSISHRGEAIPLYCGCCDGHYHDLLGVYQRWKL